MTKAFDEYSISKTILDSYHEKLRSALDSDVVIVGAGPSGLLAATILAKNGKRTVIVEAKLAPGGGIWGGGIGMNDVVLQPELAEMVECLGIRSAEMNGLIVTDACALAASLISKSLEKGAVILNLMTTEDLCVREGRVTGVVINRTGISGRFHVDPIMLTSKVVIDATGHDAVLVNYLNAHGIAIDTSTGQFAGEGAMDVVAGEQFVVDHVCEVFPGLFVTGMAVCATFNGPRMGPIFGGMLLSGKKVAAMAMEVLG